MENVAARVWTWGPCVLYLLLIVAASSIPGSSLAPVEVALSWDKLIHALEYAGLTWLVWRALVLEYQAPRGWRRAVVLVVVAVCIGGLDELYQSQVSGRYSSIYDVVADGVGGAVVATVSLFRARPIR